MEELEEIVQILAVTPLEEMIQTAVSILGMSVATFAFIHFMLWGISGVYRMFKNIINTD